MRVAFLGSPDFAVPCLEALAAAHEVALVVSQPDKPAGRGAKVHAPAVKVAAQALGLPVIQPKSARTGELRDALVASGAELCVVVAYGKILPLPVLAAVKHGCINVHGSILPKYRGAAPVQWSVIDGEAETGVSIMQLDEGMDTGPVYFTRATPIGAEETSGELMARLAGVGAEALLEAVRMIEEGRAHATAQDAAKATHAPMLDKADGAIDFARDAAKVAARIRGVDPWPGAQAQLRDQPVKLFKAIAVEGASGSPDASGAVVEGLAAGATPGLVYAIDARGAFVRCGVGAICIREIQAAGKKRMPVAAFASGRGIAVGDVLAPPGEPPPGSG